MTADEAAVREQIAQIDREQAFVRRAEDFYAGITYRAPAEEPYVSSAEFVDAVTAGQASTAAEFGLVYMRLVSQHTSGSTSGTLAVPQ